MGAAQHQQGSCSAAAGTRCRLPYLCLLRCGLRGVLLFELWYGFIAVRLCSGPYGNTHTSLLPAQVGAGDAARSQNHTASVWPLLLGAPSAEVQPSRVKQYLVEAALPATPSATSSLPSSLTTVEAPLTAAGRTCTRSWPHLGRTPAGARAPRAQRLAPECRVPRRQPQLESLPQFEARRWPVRQPGWRSAGRHSPGGNSAAPSADGGSLGCPRTCSGSSEAGVAGAQTHGMETRPNSPSPRGRCTFP